MIKDFFELYINEELKILDDLVMTKYFEEALEVVFLDGARLKALVDGLLPNLLVVSVVQLFNCCPQNQLLNDYVLLICKDRT